MKAVRDLRNQITLDPKPFVIGSQLNYRDPISPRIESKPAAAAYQRLVKQRSFRRLTMGRRRRWLPGALQHHLALRSF